MERRLGERRRRADLRRANGRMAVRGTESAWRYSGEAVALVGGGGALSCERVARWGGVNYGIIFVKRRCVLCR